MNAVLCWPHVQPDSRSAQLGGRTLHTGGANGTSRTKHRGSFVPPVEAVQRDFPIIPKFSFSSNLACGSAGEESACNVGDLGSILGWEEPLEKGKATHSSVLGWRIPWTV